MPPVTRRSLAALALLSVACARHPSATSTPPREPGVTFAPAAPAASPRAPRPASQLRAQLRATATACRAAHDVHACTCTELCAATFDPDGTTTLIALPIAGTTSGMTSEHGLVPLGPTFAFHIGPGGRVEDCGVAPDLRRCPARAPHR